MAGRSVRDSHSAALEIIYEINRRFLADVRRRYPGDEARVHASVSSRRSRRRACAWRIWRWSGRTAPMAWRAIHTDLLRTHVLRTATRSAVDQAVILAHRSRNLPSLTKMKISLGMGISFIENHLPYRQLTHDSLEQVEACSHRYDDSKLTIDHRSVFLEMISNAGRRGHFSLVVILDDAAESVNDLLWLQDLVQEYPFLHITLLVNSRQVSINFSVHHMQQIWRSPLFYELASRIGARVHLTMVDFPLMSFQPNYLPESASRIISHADAVYIKGANFFENMPVARKGNLLRLLWSTVIYPGVIRG